jgi:hypothetical protein
MASKNQSKPVSPSNTRTSSSGPAPFSGRSPTLQKQLDSYGTGGPAAIPDVSQSLQRQLDGTSAAGVGNTSGPVSVTGER